MSHGVLNERLLYYWRHGLYGHVRVLSQQALAMGSSELFANLWLACALAKEGDNEKAMEELGCLNGRVDLEVVYCVFLSCISGDYEELTEKMERSLETATSFAIHSGAFWAWVFARYRTAKWLLSYLKDKRVTALHGWMEMAAKRFDKAKELFENYLLDPTNVSDVLALYGQAVAHVELGEYTAAIQVYTKILSYYDFEEVKIEKARIYFHMRLWDMAFDSLESAQKHQCSPLEVHALLAIHDLLNSADVKGAESHLTQVLGLCRVVEPKNWRLQLLLGKCFVSLCHEKPTIVAFGRLLGEMAKTVSRQALNFLSYCEVLENNLISAALSLKDVEEGDVYSMEANIRCLFRNRHEEEASEQIDLYQVSCAHCLQVQTLFVKKVRLRDGDAGRCLLNLANALHAHVSGFHSSLSGTSLKTSQMEPILENVFGFYAAMRLDSIIQCLDELIILNKSYIYGPSGEIEQQLSDTFRLLQEMVPNFVPIRLSYAVFLSFREQYRDSVRIIKSLLISKWQYRLHLCLICAAKNELGLGNRADACDYLADLVKISDVSNLFEYVVLQARLTKELPSLPENQALSLTALIELVDVCLLCNKVKEAEMFFRRAAKMVTHPREKAALVIRQARVGAAKGNTEKAFELLKSLKRHKRYLDVATSVEAEIKLQCLHDKSGYIMCFESLCEAERSPHHLSMLGDAYSVISEYEEAAAAFKESYDLERNTTTQEKMARALCEAHNFSAAFSIYKDVGVTPLFVLDLLIKVSQYECADQLLQHSLRLLRRGDVLTWLRYMELSADVKKSLKEYEDAAKIYSVTEERYAEVLGQITASGYAGKLRIRLSAICKKLADVHNTLHDREKSVVFYAKAIQYDPSNAEAVVALFHEYKRKGDFEKCRELCINFLEKTPNSETVALLLTTIEIKDYRRSISALQNLVTKHPNYYRAIVRLIEMCGRAGCINTARKSVESCSGDSSPGMEFCRGLLCVYTSDSETAISHLLKAAASERWERAALSTLFAVYINPQRKYIWCEKEPLASREYLEKAAETLGRLKVTDEDAILMTAEYFAAHNTVATVEKSCSLFEKVLTKDTANIQAMVGVAKCKIRLGEYGAAEGMVQKVLTFKPFHETYMFFEESYLMQSHIVAHEHGLRSHTHFIFLALDLNLSSKKAWEMSAKVHKRNKMFQEAATSYRRCWELGGFKDNEVGWKCVRCLLKAKKPDDALVICKKIFDLNPVPLPKLDALVFNAFKQLWYV